MSFLKTLVGMALDVAQGRNFEFETAQFTGVCMDENENIYDGFAPEGVTIAHYEIKYPVFGRPDRTNWYEFPNGEQPDPAELAGATMEIRYDEDNPFFYEAVGKVIPRDESNHDDHNKKSFLSNFRFRFQF